MQAPAARERAVSLGLDESDRPPRRSPGPGRVIQMSPKRLPLLAQFADESDHAVEGRHLGSRRPWTTREFAIRIAQLVGPRFRRGHAPRPERSSGSMVTDHPRRGVHTPGTMASCPSPWRCARSSSPGPSVTWRRSSGRHGTGHRRLGRRRRGRARHRPHAPPGQAAQHRARSARRVVVRGAP